MPGLGINLLSVSKIVEKGNKVIFQDNCCFIYNKYDELILKSLKEDGIYKIRVNAENCFMINKVKENVML